jgi:hypothetical protein
LLSVEELEEKEMEKNMGKALSYSQTEELQKNSAVISFDFKHWPVISRFEEAWHFELRKGPQSFHLGVMDCFLGTFLVIH